MTQYRAVHSKIVQSFDFNEIPDDFGRLLWVLLPLGLDSCGRGIFNASWIKSKLFPLRDDVASDKILAVFDWLIGRGMVVVYKVDEREYFYVPTFKTYQRGLERESASVLPAPPEQVASNSGATQEQVASSARPDAEANAKAEAEAETDADAVPPSGGDNGDLKPVRPNRKETPQEFHDRREHYQEYLDLVNQFVKISKIPVPGAPILIAEWGKTLVRLRDMGATPEIQNRACRELTEKGYPISSPKSIEKACGMILAEQERKKQSAVRPRDSDGEFSAFIHR